MKTCFGKADRHRAGARRKCRRKCQRRKNGGELVQRTTSIDGGQTVWRRKATSRKRINGMTHRAAGREKYGENCGGCRDATGIAPACKLAFFACLSPPFWCCLLAL